MGCFWGFWVPTACSWRPWDASACSWFAPGRLYVPDFGRGASGERGGGRQYRSLVAGRKQRARQSAPARVSGTQAAERPFPPPGGSSSPGVRPSARAPRPTCSSAFWSAGGSSGAASCQVSSGTGGPNRGVLDGVERWSQEGFSGNKRLLRGVTELAEGCRAQRSSEEASQWERRGPEAVRETRLRDAMSASGGDLSRLQPATEGEDLSKGSLDGIEEKKSGFWHEDGCGRRSEGTRQAQSVLESNCPKGNPDGLGIHRDREHRGPGGARVTQEGLGTGRGTWERV